MKKGYNQESVLHVGLSIGFLEFAAAWLDRIWTESSAWSGYKPLKFFEMLFSWAVGKWEWWIWKISGQQFTDVRNIGVVSSAAKSGVPHWKNCSLFYKALPQTKFLARRKFVAARQGL